MSGRWSQVSHRPFGWRDLIANVGAVASAVAVAGFMFQWWTP